MSVLTEASTLERAQLEIKYAAGTLTDAERWRRKLLNVGTGSRIATVRSVLHKPAGREAAEREYAQLSEDDQRAVLEVAVKHWSLNLNLAVRNLWHAAETLGFRGDSHRPKACGADRGDLPLKGHRRAGRRAGEVRLPRLSRNRGEVRQGERRQGAPWRRPLTLR